MDSGSLTADWTQAVIDLDLVRVQELYKTNPDLLWTPLDKECTNIEADYAHLLVQLEQVQVLGDDLEHLSAIPFTLLDHLETDDEEALSSFASQQKRARLLYFLIENADADDLNTRSWGSCNNKTLHLASFLGQVQAVKQLIARGASLSVANDLGVSPKDVAQNDAVCGSTKRDSPSSKKSQATRPNYATSDRFKQLRALAESQSAAESKTSGDQRQKSQDDLKTQSRRQQDIALLAKRSPVKNNPLLKKFEQSNATASTGNGATQKDTMSPLMKQKFGYLSPDDPESFPKRTSKVISSLKNKSYVSSSVFRQGEQERPPSPSSRGPSPAPSSRAASPLSSMENIPSAPPSSPPPPPPQTQIPPLPPPDEDDKDAKKLQQTPDECDNVDDLKTQQDAEETDSTTDHEDDSDNTNNTTSINIIPTDSNAPAVPAIADETIDCDDTPRRHTLSKEPAEEQDFSSIDLQRRSSNTVATKNDVDRRSSSLSQTSVESAFDKRPLNRDSLPFVKHRQSTQSDSDSEQWFDSYEEWVENGQQGRYSMKPRPRSEVRGPSALRQSIIPQQIVAEPPIPVPRLETEADVDNHGQRTSSSTSDKGLKLDAGENAAEALVREIEQTDIPSNDGEASDDDTVRHEMERDIAAQSMDDTSIDSPTASSSFSPRQRISVGADSVDTWPPPSTLDSLDINDREEAKNFHPSAKDHVTAAQVSEKTPSLNSDHENEKEEEEEEEEKEKQQRDNSIDATAYASNKENVVAARESRHESILREEDYGHVAVSTTSRYVTHRLDQPEKPEYQEFLESQPDSLKLELPAPNYTLDTAMPQSIYGKLYVRVSTAQNILLPLPKQVTYVRCVVNDGEYEYMSKYEVLGQKVLFEHECIVDSRPDMIVTISLHVRLDDHVRPRTGLSKLFTPARKQLQTLNGYVHPEDGAIGQTRFALDHMMHACYRKTYSSDFDCFNSWYARSSKDRQRQLEDVLKVVGSLKIEMLYLPVSDPSVPVPKTLRECDLALRIRQWHETCWISGYLALRRQGSQIWERYYCRLIGSQLIAYASKEASAWKPLGQYEIADAVRLVAASDQVIITLVDLPDNRVFKEDTIVDDTGRGFFRLTFPDCYLDCVSDHAQESEEWVKMLKSMIGRVPLRVPFSV